MINRIGARDVQIAKGWYEPVSYTHLDVYKRQGSSSGIADMPDCKTVTWQMLECFIGKDLTDETSIFMVENAAVFQDGNSGPFLSAVLKG